MHAPDGHADLVFVGGRVMTMDAQRAQAEAVAVRDGRLVALGTAADVERLAGPRTRWIDLTGRTLLPSFQDAHVHPSMAGVGLLRCPLHELPVDAAGYLEAIAVYAAAHPDAPWVLGDGWYLAAFPGGTPTAAELDRAVPDRPAFFVNRDGHGAWVNSRALAVAGFTAATPDPPHGRLERDAAGNPSGTLHEGAMELMRTVVPAPTAEDRASGLLLAQAYLHRYGITAWQDAWVTPDDLAAYHLIAGRGQLTGRATACLWWEREQGGEQIESLVERRREGEIGRLRAGTVKIMQDGVAENYTAAMLVPYLGPDGEPTGNHGISFVDPEALKGYVTSLDALGFQVHFHALGDRGVREALDAVEAARQRNGWSDHRPHLAHLQLVDPADRPRFRALGATANIQPYWACHDPQMNDLTLPYLRPDRAALQYPFRSLLAEGARLAGGSDWTVSTPNVMAELEVAVTRVSPEHRHQPPFLPTEALDLIDALAAYTSGTAYVNHLDDVTGTLEVGKLADLVVLDRDLLAPDRGHMGDVRVLQTLIEGDIVFEDPALEAG
ncbi:MAG TPA: amidohydrolase family protein [Candidatus Sulfotelmatobacter sp.]|nr:amidohydrolase family protein [Candidatus Sulfotelmatobacter sp.]